MSATPQYETIIGLEIHIQLNTQSKVFCACPADSWGQPPNTNICPVCTGQPGVLPVLNEAVVAKAVRLATAVNCAEIQTRSFFDRKNYFYPDLPKGYQITQYDEPIGRAGWLEIAMPDGATRRLTIHKMHMEEDAGKTKNDAGRGARLIDMNRCGVPLIEMVTAPDLRSADEAAQFLMKLRHLLRWLDVSEANMERAHLRCDANVSIRAAGETKLNKKTEIKNVNSIEAVRTAIEAEAARQMAEVGAGRPVEAWTLDWDEETQTLRKMRSKETEADYRYFREPDLLAVVVDEAARARLLAAMPELPEARRARLRRDHRLPAYDAGLLTEERALADYYEAAVAAFGGEPKVMANWVQNEILRLAREQNAPVSALGLTPEHLAELATLVESKAITRQTAVGLMPKVMESGQAPRALVAAEGLGQISGDEALRDLARQVLAENPKEVEAYRAKPTLLKWFVGQVMRKSKGKANAPAVEAILAELLAE
ncbi:MAG: Asp-tRNA(Asn)/Glu-tRNA(Gln) amidotransferase subunit GatB [Anaerolineales bacterium]|nr:Asp-tRNA(Asn)/Glu-tRNA(Gln) amidotransferase subunit GatB [Anaerolineales bacterium]